MFGSDPFATGPIADSFKSTITSVVLVASITYNVGVLSKQVFKSLLSTLNLSTGLTKEVRVTKTATTTYVSSLVKQVQKTFSSSFVLNSGLIKQVYKELISSLSFTASIKNYVPKVISDLFISFLDIFRSKVQVKEAVNIKLPGIEKITIKHKG